MKRTGALFVICVATALLFAAPAWCAVEERQAQKDGKETVELENEFWKLTFEPARGGVCSSLFYKPAQKEFTGASGVFADYVQEQPMQQGDWAGKPYSFSVDKKADAVALTLSRPGEKYRFIKITKTITLQTNSPLIRLDYEFANQAEAMAPATISPRYHNILYLPEPCTYSFAGPNGIRRLSYVHQAAKQEKVDGWENNPSRGWGALYGEESGVGVACLFSYPTAKSLLAWLGEGENSTSTIEWFSNPITIPNGKSWKDTWYVLPFAGVAEVQEVCAEMVGGLHLDKSEAKTGQPLNVVLQIFAAMDAVAQTTYQVRQLPGTEWRILGKKELQVKTGQALSDAFGFTPAAEGTYALKATVAAAGRTLIEIERPVVVGKSSGDYVLLPREQKVALSQEKRFLPVEIKPDVVTPHWSWARPYAGGPTQVLFLLGTASLREIVELDQRMDLSYTQATLLAGETGWYPSELYAKISMDEVARQGYAEVESLLAKPGDVIVLSACGGSTPASAPAPVTWDKFTEKSREALLAKVQAGAGLVVAQPDKLNLSGELAALYKTAQPCQPADYLVKAIPFEMFPARRHRGFVVPRAGSVPPLKCGDIKTAMLGKGRIVFLDYDTRGLAPDTELEQTAFPYWEYEYSLFIRSILWAGQKESVSCIRTVEMPSLLAITAKTKGVLRATLSGIPTDGKSLLAVKIVGEDGEAESAFEVPVNGTGELTAEVPLPFLKLGRHLVTLTLWVDGKVADFYTSVARVAGPVAIEVTLTNDVLEADEPIRGAVTLKKENGWQPPDGAVLEVRLEDSDARLLFANSLPVLPDQATYPLTVNFQDRLRRLYTLTVTLRTPEQVLARVRKEVSCPSIGTSTIEEVLFPIWSGPGISEMLDLEILRRYRELGLTPTDGGSYRVRPYSYLSARAGNPAFGNANFYRLTTFQLQESSADHIRKYGTEKQCLSDPAYLKAVLGIETGTLKETLRYGSSFNVLADEPSHFAYDNPCDACWCPDCQAGFRAWLRKNYETLDALNRKWRRSFASWEEVTPAWAGDMKNEKESFAAWADFRNFMDQVYVDFNLRLAERKKEIVGDKPWGASGIETEFAPIYSGNRWEKLKDVFSFYTVYGTTELQAALQGPILGGQWNGYWRAEGAYQYLAWASLLRGGRLLPQYDHPIFFLSDLRLSPYYGPMLKSLLDEMNGGEGKLLFNSERITSPIALHYSHASAQAFYILKYHQQADTIKVFRQNMEDWKLLLRDLGYQPTFVAEEQMLNGGLALARIKVLILPLSIAISDKEQAAIRQFVAAGGVVIADCMTGKMDEHVALRETFALDPIFGVKQDRGLQLVMDTGHGTMTVGGEKKDLTIAMAGPAVALAGGSAAGGVQYTAETFGKIRFPSAAGKADGPLAIASNGDSGGQTIFMNFLPRYVGAKEAQRKVLREWLGEHLTGAGLKPPLLVTRADDNTPLPCEVNEFHNGDMRLFGLMRPLESDSLEDPGLDLKKLQAGTVKGKIAFPEAWHLYDVREQCYLGKHKTAELDLAPGCAKLIAAVPYKLKALRLKLKKSAKPGEVITYEIRLQTAQPIQAGTWAVRMDVFGPDGQPVLAYSGQRALTNGVCEGRLPLALNDPAGKWRVRVTEAITGRSAEKKFTVK